MPDAVKELFTETGVSSQTARDLIRIEKQVGREELARRALKIERDGRSVRDLVGLLEDLIDPPKLVRRITEIGLLGRAARYSDGLATNAWSSISEAAFILGWDRSDLSKAVAIARLPGPILKLFLGYRLTKDVGELLLAIEKAIGPAKMRKNAENSTCCAKHLSRDELIKTIAGVKDGPDFTL